MKYFLSIFAIITSLNFSVAQIIFKDFYSEKLKQERRLKILLPKGYSNNDKKAYPIVLVLDADYLFELVAGNTDYYAYWDEIPEVIVVGINQSETRYQDIMFSAQNSLPIDDGANFYEFIGMEVIPYIQSQYKTEIFGVAIGHGETANFINYFLLKKFPLFNAYINISPDFGPDMVNYLSERLQSTKSKIFYYMATSAYDVPRINKLSEELNTKLSQLENSNLFFKYDNFEDHSHFTMPSQAVSRGLENVFSIYQPISKKEYDEIILKIEDSPVDYLIDKYKAINDLFGIKKQIRLNDFTAIESAIEKKKNYEYFEPLSKLAKKEHPKTMLGHYYQARYYEQTGEPKKAMRTYQASYGLDEIGVLTKDLMLERADAIKADFGY